MSVPKGLQCYPVVLTLSMLLLASQLLAVDLEELEDEDESEASATPSLSVEWSGILDVRFVQSGKSRNWSDTSGDFGGPGLTRYGSVVEGLQSSNFQLGMLGLVADIFDQEERLGHVQLNYSDQRSSAQGPWGGSGIAEAYIVDQYGPLSARLGFLIPPVSLEHPNTAWSTKYTLTPSAINTWFGEEVRSLGLELDLELSKNLSMLASVFSHNDSIATLITYRGWALHDYQGTYGARLRWNQLPEEINKSDGWVQPFKEIDGKPGFYGKLSLHTTDKTTLFEVFYYDNNANPRRFDGLNYAWETSFFNLSLAHHMSNGLSFMAQAFQGRTDMGPNVVTAEFQSAFLLASWVRQEHRISLRYDTFEVQDKDNWVASLSGNTDNNDQKGSAWTFAYLNNISEKRQIGFEALIVDSQRDGNEGYGDTDPDDDQYQLNYRILF